MKSGKKKGVEKKEKRGNEKNERTKGRKKRSLEAMA